MRPGSVSSRTLTFAAPGRTAYADAVRHFVRLVRQVKEDDLDRPSIISGWTIRELIGHMTSSLRTVIDGITSPAPSPQHGTAADWLLQALGLADIDNIIEEDGRSRGLAMTRDWLQDVELLAADAEQMANGADSDLVVSTPLGPIELNEFLGSRTVELVIHSIDLAESLEVTDEPPTSAMKTCLQVLVDVSIARSESVDAIRVLSGRQRRGFNALSAVV